MTEKAKFFEIWGLTEGDPESERVWAEKLKMDAGYYIGTTPMVHVDIPAYQSPASGKWITSRSERREDLKRTNCIEYEPSMVQEQQKRHAQEDAQLDKMVEEHVEETIALMPTHKQEQLGRELEAFDVEITKG